MKRTILLLALLLAGCMNQEQELAAQNSQDDRQCLGYGARKGTDAYVTCRTQLSAARTQAESAAIAAMYSAPKGPTYCTNLGGGIVTCH
jgi:PBP1b-binding outer membrane lipoprotein LpoB